MKPSEKTRLDAIMVLDIATSHSADGPFIDYMMILTVCQELGASARATRLAILAASKCAAYQSQSRVMTSQVRGDAAGILRDGWSPGDPVEPL